MNDDENNEEELELDALSYYQQAREFAYQKLADGKDSFVQAHCGQLTPFATRYSGQATPRLLSCRSWIRTPPETSQGPRADQLV